MKRFKNRLKAMLRLLPAALLLPLASCNGMIYEGGEDCDPHYKVRFIYDRNLKYTDAFAAEVNEVTLYITNQDGEIVWQKHETGEALKSGHYMMDVEGLAPGTYNLIAWCGEGHTTDYTIRGDATRHLDLKATLGDRTNHEADWSHFSGHAVRNDFRDLYHGRLEAAEFTSEEGEHVYEIHLTKDTNDVHVVLQHLSGDPVDDNNFLFTIVEENGALDWDNSVLDDEPLTYYAHTITSGTAGLEVPDYTGDGKGHDTRTITAVSCAVADFQISRITPEKRCMVRIYNKKDKSLVCSIPLADYAVLTKGAHKKLSDADYLDYRDDYSLVLFLDDNGRWMSTMIYINSWQLVLQNTDV